MEKWEYGFTGGRRIVRMGPSALLRFGFAVLVAASACRSKEAPRPHAKPKPVASARAAASASSPSASRDEPPTTPEPPLTPEQEAVLRTVRAWNEALDRHDLDALEKLYAGTVRFYGRDRSKAAVIAAKRTAFAKQPKFNQAIVGEIHLSLSLDVFSASFLKVTGPDVLAINGTLGLKASGSNFLIVEEGDEESAKQELGARAACETKVTEVV